MKAVLISIPVFFVLLFFESTVISFPFIFLSSAVLFLTKKNIASCILILIFSLLLDSLKLSPLGFTPLFLFSLFTINIFFERVFAVEGLWFGTILSVMGLEIYRYIASYPFSIILFTVVLISASVFVYLDFKNQKESKRL